MLACPTSKLPLREVPLDTARHAIAGGAPLVGTERAEGPAPVGETATVLLRSDDAVAFPVVDGIPLLMWPEVLTSPEQRIEVDLQAPQYAEAYAEMGYYDDVATDGLADVTTHRQFDVLSTLLQADDRADFPEPTTTWLDSSYDVTAQERVYRHLAPRVAEATVVQLGGSGLHALKLLVAGASEAWLVTPVLGEAQLARRMAEKVGFAERFTSVVGVGEELPLGSETCDVALSGGSLHHMVTADVGREVRRVLEAGGRFGAWDPWRAPLYRAGIAVFGKREPDVGCRPIDHDRAAGFVQGFGAGADHERHGALSRYPLLALNKLGLTLDVGRTLPIFQRDDRLARRLPALQRLQSSVSICAEKAEHGS